MIVYKCSSCQRNVVNLQDQKPSHCLNCKSGPAYLVAVANDDGPLPSSWLDPNDPVSRVTWRPYKESEELCISHTV